LIAASVGCVLRVAVVNMPNSFAVEALLNALFTVVSLQNIDSWSFAAIPLLS
jgi:hypothetical protein